MGPVLGNGFTVFDDRTYVTENPRVRAGLGLDGLRWAFSTWRAANWHPLTWLSHMLDWQIWGPDPFGHHLTSLLLHALNAALLFLVLERATAAPGRSAFAAALFAVHPLHVESVAWIAERKDVLSTAFGLGAILAYLGWVRRPSASRYAAVCLLLIAGLMAKPMLVTLPFCFLLLDAWPLGRLGSSLDASGWREIALRVVEKAPFFAASAASCAVTFAAQRAGGAVASFDRISLTDRLANAVLAYGSYLVKTVRPSRLAAFYPYPAPAMPAWTIALAAASLGAITLAVLVSRRRFPYLAFGWLWFLGSLVPVIGIVQVGSQAMADRYTYLPLVGPFVAVSWAGFAVAEAAWGPRGGARFVAIPAAAILLALTAATRLQATYWKNSIVLFEHALASTQDNATARANLGVALEQAGREEEAVAQFEAAIRLEPRNRAARNGLGNFLTRRGRAEEAVAQFRIALEGSPGDPDTLSNLGMALGKLGRLDEAKARLEEALRAAPGSPRVLTNLGNVLAMERRYEEAAARFEEVLRLDPEDADVRGNLGSVLTRLDRDDEAAAQFAEALRLKPRSAQVHFNWGLLEAKAGRWEAAASHFAEALRIRPDFGQAREQLAIASRKVGRQ